MRHRTPQQATDWDCLPFENIRLWQALDWMDKTAQEKFGVELTLTSIFRDHNDPYGLHRHMRAADIRIYNKARDGSPNGNRPPEITESEMMVLADLANKCFRYGRTSRGTITQTVKVRLKSVGHHEDKWNDHAHVQTSRKDAWV